MRSKFAVLAFLVLGLFSCQGSSFTSQTRETKQQISPRRFEELYDLSLLPHFKDYKVRQVSSYDRTGGNNDGYYSYLYTEGDNWVIFDEKGPGCIYRIWSANPPPNCEIRFYFDGEKEPRLVSDFQGFFKNNKSPFLAPVVGTSSGGWYSYFPFPYKKSCKVVIAPGRARYYYHVTYATFPAGTLIETYKNEFSKEEEKRIKEIKLQPAYYKYYGCDVGDVKEYAGQIDFQPLEKKAFLSISDSGVIVNLHLGCDISSLGRKGILRIYWDDEREPSVETPIIDFFACGFGKCDIRRYPIGCSQTHSPNYYYLDCAFPMPFSKSVRIEIENGNKTPLSLSYSVKYYHASAENLAHFHARWRQEITRAGIQFTILQAKGRGHYVGCNYNVQGMPGLYFLEGDEMVYVDGETDSSNYNGTGTEDYFNGGWYFNAGIFSLPYHGCVVKDEARGRISAYRFHITDAIPFQKDFKITIEHGEMNTAPGCYYSCVAYWYQDEPHCTFEKFPPVAEIGFPKLTSKLPPYALRAVDLDTTTSANVEWKHKWEDLSDEWCKGESIFVDFDKTGGFVEQKFNAGYTDNYKVIAYLATGPKQGKVAIYIDGGRRGHELDCYQKEFNPSTAFELGSLKLEKGTHTIKFEVVGKNEKSQSYAFGVHGYDLIHQAPFVTQWSVIGPFPNENCVGFDKEYAPEKEIDLKASYEMDGRKLFWDTPDESNVVNFFNLFKPNENVVAYAVTFAECENDTDAMILAGSDDGIKIFINGNIVHSNHVHRGIVAGQDVVPVKLKKGVNPILVKVDQGNGGWGFCMQVVADSPITFSAEPPRAK